MAQKQIQSEAVAERESTNPVPRENKMGTTPMGRLVIGMALPLMISMLVQALYNVVDSLFVSHIVDPNIVNAGDKAVTALTLAFPLQMLMTAVNVGTGVGINAILSRYLGMKDRKNASRVAGNGIFVEFCLCLLMMLIGGLWGKAFIMSQTSDPDVIRYGAQYVRIITLLSFGTMLYFAFEKVLQATGRTQYAMICQLSGAVTNIILDPIFIFGHGVPKMGVAGAAYATVIGQIVSMIVGFILFLRRTPDIDKGFRYLKPDGHIIGNIYKIGFPAIIMSGLTSIMSYVMNIILGAVSAVTVTAFGIYYKLQNFIFMPSFGLNNACIPIIGYSYGAKRPDRIKSGLRWGMLDCMIIMAAGMILFLAAAPQIVRAFAVSSAAQQIASRALRIICLGWLFSGFNTIIQGYFQALGNGVYSLIVSLIRFAVVLLPLALALTKTANPNTWVWIAFPVAEACASIAALFLKRSIDHSRAIQ